MLCAGGSLLRTSVGAQSPGKERPGDARLLSKKPPVAPPNASPTYTLLANLSDPRITESSGIAASRRAPGVFWTHNDSGDGPYVFAIDRKGRTLARYTVTGARNVDWEDIAVGPGTDGQPALYIGDIGDNGRSRNDTAVYRVAEPKPDTGKTMQEEATAPCEKLPFRYPDGHHDCETLMVHPQTGEVFLVTKEGSGLSGVYKFPMPLTPGQQATLVKIGTITFRSSFLTGRLALAEKMATGGDIAPNGRRFVVRTYLQAYEWPLASGQSLSDALKARPRPFLLPLTGQGEAVCYRLDSRALLTTSEGAHSPLYEVSLR
jgi:hypothetical protein